MANELIESINDSWQKSSGGVDMSGACIVGNPDFGFGTHQYDGALRFTDITINQGSSVNFAKIYYKYGSVGGSGTWKFNVHGFDEDNTAAFSSSPMGRTQTTASQSYNEGAPTGGGVKEIDVSSILNEIVGRAGWSSGNAVGFILEDNGSDSDVYAFASASEAYLTYRVAAEPNFKPTPVSVSAPSLPTAGNIGMKFSQLGTSVLTATDDQLHLTTRKKLIKLFDEDIYTATAAETISIPHDLGYIPFVTVYALETDPSSVWRRLPRENNFEDHPFYFVDSDNLYLHSSDTGEKFYYRIFIDRIAT